MRYLVIALTIAALTLAVALTVAAQEQPLVTTREDPELGTILTDRDGWTLYLFTRDEPGVSNCYDQCAVNWPPLLVDGEPTGSPEVADGLGVTTRADGSQQVTYNGMPLYYWINDLQPGDTTGQNVGGVWFVVNPAPAAAAPPAAAPAAVTVTTREDPQLGTILTDADGWTLYLFTQDEPGVSNCYGQCETNWPPLLVDSEPVADPSLPGTLGVTTREDGSWQVTYNDMPLYYWINDVQPGDTTGQNVGGVWFVVNP